MSKTKTVMVDKVGGISYPENFISANKIAQLGSNIDVEFGDITSYGSLICKATDSVLNFSGLMEVGVNRRGLTPYGYISIASEIGLELPNTIITKDSLSIYDGPNSIQNNTPFVVIGNGGITTTGHLTASSLYIETDPNSANSGWNFVNGSIRYYDAYCSSEINAYNYCPRDGTGYSTIELAAHKYNQSAPESSVSINIDGRDGIKLRGPVTVNNTLLEDMIATAVSSIDLSNYQTKLNYYSESVYDDGSSHVFINADQTKIGNDKTYIDVVPNGLIGIFGTVFVNGSITVGGDINTGTYFTTHVYNEAKDGSYIKTNKTVSLRVVERDGDYTIVIDDN